MDHKEDAARRVIEAMDAGYAQGVEATEARAIKRIDEMQVDINHLAEDVVMRGRKIKELEKKYDKLLAYASKYKDHSSACSEWSGHEIQKLCDQCQEWEDLKP